MADNPYQATEYENSWHQGFVAGFLQPNEEHPAPTPLTWEQQTVYDEGVLAGRDLSEKLRIPPTTAPEEPESWEHIGAGAMHVIDAVDVVRNTYHVLAKGATVATTVAETAFFSFFVLAIWGAEGETVCFEEAAQSAANRLSRELRESGIVEEAIDLFMAVCNQNDHGVTDDDELTRQGWWHGLVYLDFDQALQEGRAHGHPDGTRVLRFQTSTPDVIEIIEIEPA